MTPKEKAEELYNKYVKILNISDMRYGTNLFVKECALKAAQEVLDFCTQESSAKEDFWFEVTEEIKKL